MIRMLWSGDFVKYYTLLSPQVIAVVSEVVFVRDENSGNNKHTLCYLGINQKCLL